MPTQITADFPDLDFPREVDYPTQEDWAAFSAAAEENFGILGGDWSTQMQLWKTQANAMSTEFNTNATIAQGLANYQGDWVSQGYTLNQTVSIGEVYYICKLTHATGQNPTDVSSLYWNLALGNWSLKADKTEVALKIDKDISPYSSKPTPVDADLIPISDSSESFGIKKLTWANLKATLKTYFDSLYMSLTENQTIGGDKSYTGKLLVVSDSGTIGYGAGSGGIVTQLTSKTTSVTLNKPNGKIIMNNGVLGAGSVAVFSVNNNLVTINDRVIIEFMADGVTDQTAYNVWKVGANANGSFFIAVKNISTNSLSNAINIQFTVIKGALT